MSDNLALYPFDNATICLTKSDLYPPLYQVFVTGTTESLDFVIELSDTGNTVDRYLQIEVLGKDNPEAIGSTTYERYINIQLSDDQVGVTVIGANDHQEKLAKDSAGNCPEG